MSTSKILLKFAKKGINLSPEAYNRVMNAENPTDFASSLIVKLKSNKFTSKDLISVSGEMVDEIIGIKKEAETPQPKLEDLKPELKKYDENLKAEPKLEDSKEDSEIPKKHVNEQDQRQI